MNKQTALERMFPPSQHRPRAWQNGVIQIWVTRNCDKACFNCTQGSQLRANKEYPQYISLEQFEHACLSLRDYFGVVGVFGGNPALHPQFEELCKILRDIIPYQRRGLWCNNPLGKARAIRITFNPNVSNLNVHLDQKAFNEFKKDWPESSPFGLHNDSVHSPGFVNLKTVVPDEATRWELISKCDINQNWSAMIGVFRGELRAWFCEIAGSHSINMQHLEDYPDTGVEVTLDGENTSAWWRHGIEFFGDQIEHHCHRCGFPLNGRGEFAQSGVEGKETVTKDYLPIYNPKKKDRKVRVVENVEELDCYSLGKVTEYLR